MHLGIGHSFVTVAGERKASSVEPGQPRLIPSRAAAFLVKTAVMNSALPRLPVSATSDDNKW